ncbi:hypothetical protein ACFL6C_01830 [Myxococcota bacterium]
MTSCRHIKDFQVLRGRLEVEVSDPNHAAQVFVLGPGDRLLVPPGSKHRVIAGDDNQVVISSITAPSNLYGPLIIAKNDQAVLASAFCGILRCALSAGTIEGIDQVVAHGLTHSVGHVHRDFDEDYLLACGTLRLALYDTRHGTTEIVELNAGDRVIIPAGVGHKVLDGSADNQVVVTCVPGFCDGDETVCQQLERLAKAERAA